MMRAGSCSFPTRAVKPRPSFRSAASAIRFSFLRVISGFRRLRVRPVSDLPEFPPVAPRVPKVAAWAVAHSGDRNLTEDRRVPESSRGAVVRSRRQPAIQLIPQRTV